MEGIPSIDPNLVDLAPYADRRFRRLTLIAHESQAAALTPDDDRLVVSCDWLAWQQLLARGIAAAFIEAGLTDWDGDGLCGDLFVRANDWIYVDDEDVTLFHGVSLGRQFLRDLHLFIYSFVRLTRALDALTEQYRPEEIKLIDLRTEFPILNAALKAHLVADVARRRGIRFIDAQDAIDDDDIGYPLGTGNFRIDSALITTPRSFTRRAYDRILDMVSAAVARIRPARGTVLLCATPFTLSPMIERLKSNSVAPAMLAWRAPRKKDFRFTLHGLGHRVRWIAERKQRLTAEDRAALDTMVTRLKDAWRISAAACCAFEAAMRTFVEYRILKPGRLERMALEVKTCEEIFDRLDPQRVLVDSMEAPTARILAAIGTNRSIGVDFTLHGLEIENLKLDILGSDSRQKSTIERFLSWGPHCVGWLRDIGATCTVQQVGHPLSSIAKLKPEWREWKRALVLQGSPGICNIRGLHHNQYNYFVRIVRQLNAEGITDVRVKLHPGAWRGEYYERIKAFFGLQCEILINGNFQEFVRWSDFVVGPASSGAMPETLALGRPYFPVILTPHCADREIVTKIKGYESLDALLAGLQHRTPPDLSGAVEFLLGEIGDSVPADAIWRALEKSALAAAR